MKDTKKIVKILLIINALQLAVGLAALLWMNYVTYEEKEQLLRYMLIILSLTSFVILAGLYLAWKGKDDAYEQIMHHLEVQNTTLRAQRHDYLNHFQVIYGLLELDEYEEAKKYLKPVYQEITKVGKVLKTAQPAVNALLQAKWQAAEAAGVTVYFDIHSNLKELPLEAWNLCKVLANLIDNGIRAVTENTLDPMIKILIDESEKEYYFTIVNNGPMIEPRFQQMIFQPGVTTKTGEGHGMGLYIVNKIIQEAGGSVRLSSSEGRTAFDIILPKENMVKQKQKKA